MKFLQEYTEKVKRSLDLIDLEKVKELAFKIKNAKRIYTYGNGGSGATASHFAGDVRKSLGYKIFCLNDNNTALTAWANDSSYEEIFLNQLYDLYEEDDLCIAFTGSGDSKNIVMTEQYKPFIICGFKSGYFKEYKDKLHIPVNDMEVFEDLSLVICHMIKRLLMEG